jgi:SAM-dependent methyltransferase
MLDHIRPHGLVGTYLEGSKGALRRTHDMEETKVYVQFGCGMCAPKGWLNYDGSPTVWLQRLSLVGPMFSLLPTKFPQNVIYGDIVRGLPLKSNSCNAVYASHVLEHLSREDFDRALKETFRILKPGGTFRLVVPDLECLAKRYIDGLTSGRVSAAEEFLDATAFGIRVRSSGPTKVLSLLFGSSAHLWMWDYPALEDALTKFGYIAIRRASFGDSVDKAFAAVEDEARFQDGVCVECSRP